MGEVANLLEIWGASFADLIQQTGFGELGRGIHGHEENYLAARPKMAESVMDYSEPFRWG